MTDCKFISSVVVCMALIGYIEYIQTVNTKMHWETMMITRSKIRNEQQLANLTISNESSPAKTIDKEALTNPCSIIIYFSGKVEELFGFEIMDLMDILILDGFAKTSALTYGGNLGKTNNHIGYLNPTRGLATFAMEKFTNAVLELEKKMEAANPWTGGRYVPTGQFLRYRQYMLVKITMKSEKENKEWLIDMSAVEKYSWP